MTISVRMNDRETDLIKSYAQLHGKTVSEFMRQAALERIEDEFDLKAYERAIAEYRQNPVSYPLEEVIKELALD